MKKLLLSRFKANLAFIENQENYYVMFSNEKNISETPFDDDFVRCHLAELLALKIDKLYITQDQIVKVEEILDLAGNSDEQLQAKRNSVVKLLTEDSKDEAAWATMSGVTCVIDRLIKLPI